MRITKDEARILAAALEEFNFIISIGKPEQFQKLEALRNRLEAHGKDQRRTGRHSLDDFNDLLKRYKPKDGQNR